MVVLNVPPFIMTYAAIRQKRLDIENAQVVNAQITAPAGGTVTPGFLSTSASGTVAAGARSVSIANSGGAVGTALGTNVPVGVTVSWGANNGTLGAIAYNATGTTFLITEVR